jgi:dipeptidyl aminopeptidase/acylaminoacyl peptidase
MPGSLSVCRFLLLALPLLFAAPISASGQAEVSTPVSASAVRIEEKGPFKLPDGLRPLSLSPNGRWLAASPGTGKQLCAFAVDDLAAPPVCADRPDVRHDVWNVTWSPDGSRLAFTEDFRLSYEESDLLVWDLATGDVTNLTDDGASGGVIDLPEGVPADGVPTWSPDGTELAFARSVFQGGADYRGTAIYRIGEKGGTPELVYEVTPEREFVVTGLRWSPDGTRLVFSVLGAYDDPTNGLWTVGVEGDGAQQLLGREPELGNPSLAAVSPRGDLALVTYPEYYIANPFNRDSPYALANLTTGQATRLDALGSEAADHRYPEVVTFSPDGNMLLFAVRQPDPGAPGTLVVRDIDGASEHVLLDAVTFLRPWLDPGHGLAWAADGTVLLETSGPSGEGLLLLLAGAGQATPPAATPVA